MDALKIKEMFISACNKIIENKDELTAIDSTFGDGDHGITMEKISKVMIKKLNELENGMDLNEFFDDLSCEVLDVNGGSATPLWGTFIGGMANGIKTGSLELDTEDVKNMIKSGCGELCEISRAKVGDKTMMDALIPATKAIEKSTGTIEEVLKNGMESAIQGAKDSENYIAKFGRAKSYKEKTIGTPDAGAESMKYFFIGLYEGSK